MPSAPASLCRDCSKRALEGSRYCSDHQTYNRRVESSRAYDKNRREHDPFHSLYKGLRWIALAARVRREQPLCAVCGHQASKDVDHIIPARVYVAAHNNDINSFYDRANLQGLCKSDHSAKTMRGE